MKLTKKQQELVDLINNKQDEIGQKIYVRHFGHFGMCLIKVIDNIKCEIVQSKINSKIIYALLDKGVLIEEKQENNITLVGLKA